MAEFYTNVIGNYKNLTYIGYRDGKRIKEIVEFDPELYIPTNEETRFIGLDGKHLTHIQKTYGEYFSFIKEYKDEIPIYGNISPTYQFLYSKFGDKNGIYYDMSLLRILYFDIEVLSLEGFPNVNKADCPITCISMKDYNSGKFYVLSLKDYDKSKCELEGVNKDDIYFKKMNSESELLSATIYIMKQLSLDAITGWNINEFDIPYLTNRTAKLLGVDELKKLSPTGRISLRHFETLSKTIIQYYDFYIPVIDYLDLYKKFTYTNRESYTLDYIAKVEIKKQKLKFDGSLADLWSNNPQKYIEYNIWDAELVYLLNKKLGLIETGIDIAYESKVLFKDVFSPVRTWDVIIYNALKKKNIQIPPSKLIGGKPDMPGGYVLDVRKGINSWIISFDLNSLYPHIIINANISPETLVEDVPEEIANYIANNFFKGNHVDDIVKMDYHKHITEYILAKNPIMDELFELIKKYDLTMTPNLQFWKRDKIGIVGEKMESIYSDRVKVKDKMFEKKDGKFIKIKSLDLKQTALKYLLNCGWGIFANIYYRYFGIPVASGITTSGQLISRYMKQEIEKISKGDIVVIAGDTDSMYICLDKIVEEFKKKNPTAAIKDIIDFIEKYNNEFLSKHIKNILNELSEKLNFIKRSLEMKREVIADKGLWTAKKKYIIRVLLDDKGLLEKPNIVIKGVEIIKSSTPEVVREKLRDVIELILSADQKELIAVIKAYKKVFEKETVERIAFPRSISDVEKYYDPRLVYTKKTPMHVRGALLYNLFLQKLELENKYKRIYSGDKLKFVYLKVPNPNRNENTIAFIDKLPEEFNLNKYVDYDLQFEKCYLAAVNVLTKPCGYDIIKKLNDHTESIADLFW